MSQAATAKNSSFRGFLRPGTEFPFTWTPPQLGWNTGLWDDTQADPNSSTLSGQALDDFFQQVVAAITGIAQEYVWPRWQEEPPNAPAITVDWAAVGVTRSQPQGFSYETVLTLGAAAGSGYLQSSDWENFDVLCSFYGPNADANAMLLRKGLMIAQNRECMQLLNMGLVQTSGRTRVPTLFQGRNRERVDITIMMTREVRAYYPVLYFLSASDTVDTDTGVTVTAPPHRGG